jgi:uncharacterized protein (TIGR03437 family)
MKNALLILFSGLTAHISAQNYTFTTFDPPGSTSTTASAINNGGQVVGTYKDSSGVTHSYIRNADGAFTVFDAPGAVPGTTLATGINNNGQVVGSYESSTTNSVTHGFLRSADGQTYTAFDVPGVGAPGQFTSPTSINDQGAIVGQQFNGAGVSYGFLRSADGFSFTKVNVPGSTFTATFSINNSGQIVGWYHAGGSGSLNHGFIRGADGTYTEFEVPGFIAGSNPTWINNKGQILSAPFVVSADRSSFVIQSAQQIAPASINDNGVIAGTIFSNQANHGFVAVPSGPPPTTPTIRSASGVITASAFGGFNAIAPGTWIEIYGSNLANTSRPWQTSDFTGSTAPTSLSGASVSINGQPAFVSYISPGQVNAQVPSTLTPGSATITVTNGQQTSNSYTTTLNAVEPGLLTIAADVYYAGALFPDFTTYVLPPGITSLVPSRPADPGDTIVFYGVGFGPVTPDVPAGQITSGQHPLQANLQVFFASLPGQTGVPAEVTYAGMAPGTVGLYQFNVVVPNVQPTGFPAVITQFTLNGVPLPQTPASPASPPLYVGFSVR